MATESRASAIWGLESPALESLVLEASVSRSRASGLFVSDSTIAEIGNNQSQG